ncbi:MAG: hypothetical protein V3T86_17030 [Planctomycetota bacterium]
MRILAVLLALSVSAVSVAGPGPSSTKPKTKSKASKARTTRKQYESLVNKLTTRKITVKLENRPLKDFLKFVRVAADINIVIDRSALRKENIDPDAIEIDMDLRNVKVIDALKIGLEPLKLALKVKGNVLLVTTKKAARGKPVLVVYSVATLLFPIRDFPAPDMNLHPSGYERPEPEEAEVHQAIESADELAELVRQFSGQETWEDEGIQITVFRRHLFIRQYPGVHRQIARLLRQLQGLQ